MKLKLAYRVKTFVLFAAILVAACAAASAWIDRAAPHGHDLLADTPALGGGASNFAQSGGVVPDA